MGSLFGAVVMGLAFWSSWTRLQDERSKTEIQSADRVLRDRYVARMLDFAHLALMLRGIEPSLERDWIEESLAIHARELNEDLRDSRIAGHAMKMITGYYTKNNLPVPKELEQIWQSLREDPVLAAGYSDWSITAAYNERLAEFDAYMDARRAFQESDLRTNWPIDTIPSGRPAGASEYLKTWGSTVSF
jgi:hypothetical protein